MTLVISVLALATSLLTAWLTLLRRGRVRMTHPSYIYLGPHSFSVKDTRPNVALRTLLFCTARRGRVIEFMYATLKRNETRQNFTRWITEQGERGSLGSGLFVGEEGVATTHHFFLPMDESVFHFQAGDYQLEVMAKLVDQAKPKRLFVAELYINAEHGRALADQHAGIHFDWGPETGKYIGRVEHSFEFHDEQVTAKNEIPIQAGD